MTSYVPQGTRSSSEFLLLDGATGTELDRRGVDVSLPLWSARAIIEAPDVLQEVHRAYLTAGAKCITANTFRTHERSLAKGGLGHRAKELTARAVAIARAACDEVNPQAMVWGSVAPLEDCYSPGLTPDSQACRREHGQMITHLIEAGVDLIVLETMCGADESLAAIDAAREIAPGKWAISFCLTSGDTPGVLLDGTPLARLIPQLEGARFIGINCIAATELADQVRYLRTLVPGTVPIAAYGNVGYPDDERGWINTDAIDPDRYARYAMEWIDAGASIVGGCCGTTPATIKAITTAMEHRS